MEWKWRQDNRYDRCKWPNPYSDHRGLFVDLDELAKLGANLHTVIPPIQRKIVSTSKTLVTKLLENIEQQQQIPQLLNDINNLGHLTERNLKNRQALHYHSSNSRRTMRYTDSILLEPSSRPILTYPHILVDKVTRSEKQHWCDSRTTKIRKKLSDENDLHQGLNTTNVIIQLRHARRTLINSRLQSEEIRDKHLEVRQETLIEQGSISEATAIRQKQSRERQRSCWRILKALKSGTK
jgi:hypothetical protein